MILKHRPDLYEKYIHPWDEYANSADVMNNVEISSLIDRYPAYYTLQYRNEQTEHPVKQLLSIQLNQTCHRYTNALYGFNVDARVFDNDYYTPQLERERLACYLLSTLDGGKQQVTNITAEAKRKAQERNMKRQESQQESQRESQQVAKELCSSMSLNDLSLSLASADTREAEAAVNTLFGALLGGKFQGSTQLSSQTNQQMAQILGANPNAMNQSPKTIISSCQPACSQNNGKACAFVGRILLHNEQVTQAEPYLNKGCNNGYGMACIWLERFHYHENKARVDTKPTLQTCRYEYGTKVDCVEHNGPLTPHYSIQRTGKVSTVIKGRKPNKERALQYRKKGLALLQKSCQQGDREMCSLYQNYSDLNRERLGDY